jgi:nucleotide-binding universal stress UspA family protein/enoyl-CoA hydratase/carnithine racemase
MRVKVKSIMCATDFSDFSNLALNYGVAMAREFDAKLYVCHVVDVSPTALYGEAVADLSRQHQRLIQSATEKLGQMAADYAIDCEPMVVSGHAADEICRLAEEKAVELVVCSTHGRAGLKRLILGSVAERLMRILPCPLLIIRALKQDLSLNGELSLKRILVGCDFSPDSNLAFMHGLSLAQEFQSELHLVNVMESAGNQETAEGGELPESPHYQDTYASLNQKLQDMVSDESCNWCTLKTAVLTGRSYEGLVDYANKYDIDIIVLGARGRGLVAKLFVGSTTDRVIRQAPCPVLAVRPLDRENLVNGTKGRRKRSSTHHAVKSDFFSTSRHQEIVTINFHKNLLVHTVDLSARDRLLDYLEQVSNIREIRAVVFIGSDQKTGREEYIQFYNHILNADLDRNAIHKMFNAIDQIILKIVDLDKFVIHADRGQIISLFLNISLACDYRIIADNTIYQNPSIGLGMAPKGGGAFFLLKMLGHSKAFEILLSEQDLTAREALRLGIVDSVVPPKELEKKAFDIAKTYAQIPPQSLTSIKRLLNFSKRELAEYLEFENQELMRIIGPPDLSSEFWEKLMECR